MRRRRLRPDRQEARDPTFYGVVTVWHVWSGPAMVTITPGSVECLGWFYEWTAGRTLIHERPEVVVKRARLLPWPLRTWIELTGAPGQTARFAPIDEFRGVDRMLRTLEEAGFLVRERRVWLMPF